MAEKKAPAHYLKLMAHYARQLHEVGIDHAAWAADKRYVRINGGGLRPVSLCADSPCGAVQGHGVRKTTTHLLKARYAPVPAPGERKPKPEHRWQAALIEHALRWPEALPALLHMRDVCDEIRFVTDELSIGGIRADVVLVGRKGSQWFPVFIELKVHRNLTRLLEQLEDIGELSCFDAATGTAFEEFLATAATIDGKVHLQNALKVMIWPSAAGSSPHLQRALDKGVRVLEFAYGSEPLRDCNEPSLAFVPVTPRPV